MRAVTWQGRHQVAIKDVPDPGCVSAHDAVIRVTATAICGSDLHLYGGFIPFMAPGDILGHEVMGVVEEVGPAITGLTVGDIVVVPFGIACGECVMCRAGLHSQCETTQVYAHGCGASLFGYSALYGSVPGGQAELLRVPYADVGPIRIGRRDDLDQLDDRHLLLADVLPTAWQAVEYAQAPPDGTVAVLGLGPVGQLCTRIARHRGMTVLGIDPVPSRREMAERHGIEALDPSQTAVVRRRTDGRGPDAVIDAVGMEAHGSPVLQGVQAIASRLPRAVAQPLTLRAGVDRVAALRSAVSLVRRGGTISVVGVYGGNIDPLPLREIFDKQLQLRFGQCNVHHWISEVLPLVEDPQDPLGLADLITHRLPLDAAPEAYAMFQAKDDACVKVVLHPGA